MSEKRPIKQFSSMQANIYLIHTHTLDNIIQMRWVFVSAIVQLYNEITLNQLRAEPRQSWIQQKNPELASFDKTCTGQ